MLIALAGHAGSGKTTATEILLETCKSEIVYLGDVVREEVVRRGLTQNARNEKLVREELREHEGHDAFARRSAHRIREILLRGDVALLDAVYHPLEFAFLLDEISSDAILLAIHASHETRAARLAERPGRPIMAVDLAIRDAYEIETLHMGEVLEIATPIDNEGSLADLSQALVAFIRSRAP